MKPSLYIDLFPYHPWFWYVKVDLYILWRFYPQQTFMDYFISSELDRNNKQYW